MSQRGPYGEVVRRAAVLLALALVAVSACTSTATKPIAHRTPPSQHPKAAPCTAATPRPYTHVIWIWMENRTYESVLGSGDAAPRLASYARQCGLATRDYAIAHGSLPNYIAATSGSTGDITGDCEPNGCFQNRASLFGQLGAQGKQWRAYAEGMNVACDRVSHGRYAARHNPAVYYVPIAAQCAQWDVPFAELAPALTNKTLPSFAFVTPDLCDDGHDCATSTADRWLGNVLDRVVASPAYVAGNTVVFVTWDEGVAPDEHIATVVIAPSVRPGTRSARTYTHYSLLRTTEELLGLPLLGAARRATSMRSAFNI